MKKYVVTGGAGMIGSSLVLKLLAEENEVLVIDNLTSGKIENLKKAESFDNFKFIEGDIKNKDVLKENFKNIDCVFHLAANPDIKFKEGDPTDRDLNENTIGTYNVLEAARLNGIKKIVFTSSSAIYGEPSLFPTPENYGPLLPISLYGASKLADEALITSFSHLFDMQAWIYRLANVVGNKSRKRGKTVLTDFIEKLAKDKNHLEILGNGSQKKSFLWVEDCIEGILTLFRKADGKINLINLGNLDSITVNEIAETVISAMDLADVDISYSGGERGWKGDSPVMLLDVSRAKKLGWSPIFSSSESVTKSAKELIKLL